MWLFENKGTKVVLKLMEDGRQADHEVRVLAKLQGVPHVVQLCSPATATGRIHCNGKWRNGFLINSAGTRSLGLKNITSADLTTLLWHDVDGTADHNEAAYRLPTLGSPGMSASCCRYVSQCPMECVPLAPKG